MDAASLLRQLRQRAQEARIELDNSRAQNGAMAVPVSSGAPQGAAQATVTTTASLQHPGSPQPELGNGGPSPSTDSSFAAIFQSQEMARLRDQLVKERTKNAMQEARIEALQHQVNQLHQLLQAKSVANAAMVGDAVGGQPPQVTAYIMQLEDTVERLQQQLGEGVGSSKAHGRAGGAGGATHGGNTTSANKTHGGGTRSRRLQPLHPSPASPKKLSVKFTPVAGTEAALVATVAAAAASKPDLAGWASHSVRSTSPRAGDEGSNQRAAKTSGGAEPVLLPPPPARAQARAQAQAQAAAAAQGGVPPPTLPVYPTTAPATHAGSNGGSSRPLTIRSMFAEASATHPPLLMSTPAPFVSLPPPGSSLSHPRQLLGQGTGGGATSPALGVGAVGTPSGGAVHAAAANGSGSGDGSGTSPAGGGVLHTRVDVVTPRPDAAGHGDGGGGRSGGGGGRSGGGGGRSGGGGGRSGGGGGRSGGGGGGGGAGRFTRPTVSSAKKAAAGHSKKRAVKNRVRDSWGKKARGRGRGRRKGGDRATRRRRPRDRTGAASGVAPEDRPAFVLPAKDSFRLAPSHESHRLRIPKGVASAKPPVLSIDLGGDSDGSDVSEASSGGITQGSVRRFQSFMLDGM